MYNSNHTLTTFSYSDSTNTTIIQETKTNVESSLVINRRRGRNSHAAGREKVIETQLNINNRLELSRLQGVDYSYSNLFAVIEPILLPEVLETVKKRGQNNLHQMLLATAPDLLLQKSCSERKNCPEKDATIKNWMLSMSTKPQSLLNGTYARLMPLLQRNCNSSKTWHQSKMNTSIQCRCWQKC